MSISRLTKRRRVFDEEDNEGEIEGDGLPSFGVPEQSASVDSASQSQPTHSWPSEPQEPPPGGSPRRKRKRGRPSYDLNDSARRGIIRLLVESPKSSKKIEEAVWRYGGPGRLWIRKFFGKVAGAGKGTDVALRDARLNVAEPSEVDDEGPRGVDQPVTETENDFDEFVHYERTQNLSSGTAEDLQHQEARDTSEKMRQPASRQREHRHASQDISSSQDVRGYSASEIPPRSNTVVRGISSADFTERHHTPLIPPGQAQGSIQLPRHRVAPQEEPRKKGTKLVRLIKKRRATTMSLKGPAIELDGGKEGDNYRIAKINTISRQMSEKLKRNCSEFDNYDRLSYMHFVPPTPSTYPLSSGLFQTAPPPEAVAVTILMKHRAKRLDHEVDDKTVRDELKTRLPTSKDEREVFVTTTDRLGVSPLHLAVAYGYPLTCRLLLENGASPRVYTDKGTNISDFAEPATRRAGRDFVLYFRILHCRKLVRVWRPPAVEIKDVSNWQTPSTTKNASSPVPNPNSLRFDSSHNQVGPSLEHMNRLRTGASSILGPEAQPSWLPGDYTDSPTPAGPRKQHSLPFSDDDDDVSPQTLARRRTTVTPLLSSPSYYSGTSLSMSDYANAAPTGNNVVGHGDFGQPGLLYGIAPLMQQTRQNSSAVQDGGQRGLLRDAASTQSTYPNQYQNLPSTGEWETPFDQTGYPSHPTPANTQRSPEVEGPVISNPGYGHAQPARSGLNVASSATHATQAGLAYVGEHLGHFPSATAAAQPYTTPVQADDPFNVRYNEHLEQYPASHATEHQGRSGWLSGVSQASFQSPISIVSTAAHYPNDPGMYQVTPTSNSPITYDEGVTSDMWYCIGNNPQCGITWICDRCIQEYRMY